MVAIPGEGLRFLAEENRPYVHSLNLRIDTDRVIYITDCGVGQTILPLASQLEQDKYAWTTKTDSNIDQGMPWSNAMAYGVAHDLVPWVEADLSFLSYHCGVTLSDIELWAHYGDCLIQKLGVTEFFDEVYQIDADLWVQETPPTTNVIHVDVDDALNCLEDLEDKPHCVRKLLLP